MAIEPPKHAEDSPTVVVLHVEDDAAVASSVRMLLKTCGYQTRTFANAEVPWMPGAPRSKSTQLTLTIAPKPASNMSFCASQTSPWVPR